MEVLIRSILIPAGFLILFSISAVFLYQIPIRVTFSGSRKSGTGEIQTCIGWGLIDLCILPSGSAWQGEVRFGGAVLIHKQKSQEISDTGMSFQAEEESSPADLLQYVPLVRKIVPKIFNHLRIGEITGDIRLGAGDPVSTGLVYGYYQAARPLIPEKTCSIDLIPDFNQCILEGEMTAVLLINQPFGLIIRVFAIISPEILKRIIPPGGDIRKSGAFV